MLQIERIKPCLFVFCCFRYFSLTTDCETFFGDFRGILSRAEIEFAEEEKDSGSEVVEGAEAARIGLDGLDA